MLLGEGKDDAVDDIGAALGEIVKFYGWGELWEDIHNGLFCLLIALLNS